MDDIQINKDIKILVAEDTASNYMLIEAMIGKFFTLVHALNGKEALDLYKSETPDIILMDIRMPEMDGLEATKIIRKENKDIPIIMQSAFVFNEDMKKAFDVGCSEYISKPFTKKQLVGTISKFLNV